MRHGRVTPQIARGLLALRERFEAAAVPPSTVDETLNIATWNIRELGKRRRSQAAIHYIAEIIGQFDLVGIVELRDDLADLGRILEVLGPDWGTVYSDAIPDPAGNRERLAYVFDRRTVRFNGLAAEASEPRRKRGRQYLPAHSFWRSPYIASFRSGRFDFVVLSVHVQYSAAGREQELARLAEWIEAKRQERHTEDRDLLVMGDFNIPSRRGKHFAAISKYGLQLPAALAAVEHGSNLARNKRYDQILHYPHYPEAFCNAGGVLDFFGSVRHMQRLFAGMSKTAFTYQVSDHLPLWIQVRTDLDGFELDQVIRG